MYAVSSLGSYSREGVNFSTSVPRRGGGVKHEGELLKEIRYLPCMLTLIDFVLTLVFVACRWKQSKLAFCRTAGHSNWRSGWMFSFSGYFFLSETIFVLLFKQVVFFLLSYDFDFASSFVWFEDPLFLQRSIEKGAEKGKEEVGGGGGGVFCTC